MVGGGVRVSCEGVGGICPLTQRGACMAATPLHRLRRHGLTRTYPHAVSTALPHLHNAPSPALPCPVLQTAESDGMLVQNPAALRQYNERCRQIAEQERQLAELEEKRQLARQTIDDVTVGGGRGCSCAYVPHNPAAASWHAPPPRPHTTCHTPPATPHPSHTTPHHTTCHNPTHSPQLTPRHPAAPLLLPPLAAEPVAARAAAHRVHRQRHLLSQPPHRGVRRGRGTARGAGRGL